MKKIPKERRTSPLLIVVFLVIAMSFVFSFIFAGFKETGFFIALGAGS